MTKRWLALIAVFAIIAACNPAGTKTPAPTGGAVTGTAKLGAWESSPSERSALASALAAYNVKQSAITVTQETVAGDYRAQMITRFGAHNPPDLFYVNAEYARDWADQSFLEPLDAYIARDSFDVSKFFPDYLNIFKGTDGKIYGLPKDGNTIAMGVNTDLVATVPTTLDELLTTATALKGQGALKAPMCMNAGLDRGLGFIYAQGGSLLSADGKTETITSAPSKAAVQWYLDLFKNGLAKTNGDMGDGWCGEALGKGDVAMAFEGGWLFGYMRDSFPETKWKFAEMPTGSSGSKVTISYTAAYGIGADSANKEQAWEVIKYLTGREGMAIWTGGGIAVPSRSDVPVPAGFETIVAGAAYSKPGSGFIKGYGDIQKAFGDAMTLEIQNGTYQADAVVNATAAAITAQLAQP